MVQIQAKLSIKEKDNAPPRVNVIGILQEILPDSFSFERDENALIINCTLSDRALFKDLKHRLGAKRNRPLTIIEVLSYEEMSGDK